MPDKVDKAAARIDFQVSAKKELASNRDKMIKLMESQKAMFSDADKKTLEDIIDRLGQFIIGIS